MNSTLPLPACGCACAVPSLAPQNTLVRLRGSSSSKVSSAWKRHTPSSDGRAGHQIASSVCVRTAQRTTEQQKCSTGRDRGYAHSRPDHSQQSTFLGVALYCNACHRLLILVQD
eukprot:1253744-Rhodomonas_salina.3